ncbi:FACT complex subunit SSRP1-like [Clavelina lepadiformis]|uniref:FACT complex subunit SSRP1-like n=1 Tax=Clavelina lepadiformis TaxID=159417 RepID=UPI0040422F65
MAMNGELLDFKDIFQESRGAMLDGRLQILSEKFVFKNNKTGKIDTIANSDVSGIVWRRVARDNELKLTLKNGHIFKFDGFKDKEFERINSFVKSRYGMEVEQQELSGKGWNWGSVDFQGYEMQFDVGSKLSFEIPLSNVSQCTQSKDEVALEFHQNDDSELSLMEMRFYIPPSQDDSVDKVKEFHESVMAKADVLQVKGNAICIFQDLQCLTPRGRYDIRMYPKFIQLHGKTFDYKITYTSILRLFLLPHKDQRQIFFVVSLDPPLKQGQTRYHFLILLFYKEDDLFAELTLSDEEIEERFDGKLQKTMSGPMYEVVSRVVKHLVQRKITVPGSYKGVGGVQSITCTYKASSGFLYPLERGFMYVHKPPVHIRFDEIATVNFARGTTKINRSFDFEVETRSKGNYVFSNIERDQYAALYDFVSNKKLKIKNIGKGGINYDTMQESDDDDVHDPYMERMKQEAAARDEEDNDDDEESEDEDFQPTEQNENDVAEEFDSDAESSEEDESGKEEEDSEEEQRPKKRPKEKKVVKERAPKETGSRKRKAKKDPNAPKRPPSAYLQWLNDNRAKLKHENPGISITELSKLAGQQWSKVDRSVKEKYEQKYRKAKEVYEVSMREYKQSGGASTTSPPVKKSKSKPSSQNTGKVTTNTTPTKYKSKEFITESDSLSSSDSEEETKPKSSSKKAPPSPQADSEEESEAEQTPASSSEEEDEDDDSD